MYNNKRFRNAVLHSTVYPRADCEHDHLSHIQNKCTAKKQKKTKATPKLQYGKLQNDSICKQAQAVIDKYKILELKVGKTLREQQRKQQKKSSQGKRDKNKMRDGWNFKVSEQ